MTKHFQNEIERLKKHILYMAAMVEKSLVSSVQSFNDRDLELADEVIDSDPKIDSQEVEVEEECLKILALHQPVAADLRYVVAVLKINNDLERIADLAVNIAKRTKNIITNGTVKMPIDLNQMVDLAIQMVRESVDSLVQNDIAKASQVILNDDEIDNYHKQNYKIGQEHIKANPEATEYYISLLSVSRNLERIADHATNIAEDVIYMIEGEIVRHKGSFI